MNSEENSNKKAEKNIIIKYDLCVLCGTCTALFPDVFRFSEDGTKIEVDQFAVGDHEIDELISCCPVGAIVSVDNRD